MISIAVFLFQIYDSRIVVSLIKVAIIKATTSCY